MSSRRFGPLVLVTFSLVACATGADPGEQLADTDVAETDDAGSDSATDDAATTDSEDATVGDSGADTSIGGDSAASEAAFDAADGASDATAADTAAADTSIVDASDTATADTAIDDTATADTAIDAATADARDSASEDAKDASDAAEAGCLSHADCSGVVVTQCTIAQCVSGTCQIFPKNDNTLCDDGNVSTSNDKCTGGVCAGSNLCVGVICTAPDSCHTIGTCNPGTGTCSAQGVKDDNTPCNDGNASTGNDKCTGGVCAGSNLCVGVTCPAPDSCHTIGTCNPGTGTCSAQGVKDDDTPCNDGNASTGNDKCTGGVCAGSNLCVGVTCPAPDSCHTIGTCNPGTGTCSAQGVKDDNTTCDDGNAATGNDKCTGGVCAGSNLCVGVTCPAPDSCHTIGTCNPGTGTCSAQGVKADNDPCDDGNASTGNDKCTGGVCAGSNLCVGVTCPAPDNCHTIGICNPGTGVCGAPPAKDNNTPCDDGKTCTVSEACQSGVCTPGTITTNAACAQDGGQACNSIGACVLRPTVTATSPANSVTALANSTIALTFSTAMTPATLTAQTSAGACSGSIQISADNFASCVAMSSASATMSGSNTIATLTPQPGLLVNTTYKIRVTTAASSATGVTMSPQFEQANGFTTGSPNLCDGSLVISQVYGGGGNTGAPYNRDFIEIRNRGTTAVSLNGMSIQQTSAAGTTWTVVALPNVMLDPGAYFLLGGATGATGAALPTVDGTSTLNLGVADGKVALVASTTALSGACPASNAIVDLIGWGSAASCKEGANNAPAHANTTSLHRAQAGCADVNNNGSDFATAAPNPRNTSTVATVCGCYALNESGTEADYCNVQDPPSINKQAALTSTAIYGRLYEASMTPAALGHASVRAQLGYGPATANPQYQTGFTWANATFNVQVGNDDEYQATLVTPAAGSYRYVYRMSLDQGVSWTYCDANGAGSNAGLTFDLANLPVLTSTP